MMDYAELSAAYQAAIQTISGLGTELEESEQGRDNARENLKASRRECSTLKHRCIRAEEREAELSQKLSEVKISQSPIGSTFVSRETHKKLIADLNEMEGVLQQERWLRHRRFLEAKQLREVLGIARSQEDSYREQLADYESRLNDITESKLSLQTSKDSVTDKAHNALVDAVVHQGKAIDDLEKKVASLQELVEGRIDDLFTKTAKDRQRVDKNEGMASVARGRIDDLEKELASTLSRVRNLEWFDTGEPE